MFSAATKESADNTIREAKTTAASAKRDVRAAANDTASTAGGELTVIAERAGKQVRHFIDTAEHQLHDVSDKVSSEIRQHPLRSGAIAVGAGVLLGMLLRR